MFDDCDIVFDDKFIRDNLSFLLDDEFSGITKFQLPRENEISIKNVISKLECSMNMSWSSSSSGSICSIKEETTKYVNVCLCPKQKPSLPLESRFCFDFDAGDASPQCDDSFTKDFPTNSTSTPIKNKDRAALPETKSSSEIWNDTSILGEAVNDSSCTLEAENICNFCRKNGEPDYVYSSHLTKMTDGTVICPILKKHTCELCGATGRKAHTRKYCPLYKRKFQPPTSTRRLSNGVVVSRFNHK